MEQNPYKPPSDLAERPTNKRWGVFAMVFGASWLLYIHRYAFGFIKPALAEEKGLDNLELGILDSCFDVSYALGQFGLGPMIDLLGVRLMLPSLMMIWMGGFAMLAWAPTLFWLKTSQISLGLGQSCVLGNINRTSRAWFPNRIRTTLQGLVGVFASRFGGMCGGLIFATLMIGTLGLDWQTSIYILVGVGVAHTLVIIVFFRNSPATHPGVNAAEAALFDSQEKVAKSGKMSVGEMLKSLSPRGILNFFALNIQSITSNIADKIYSAWIPLFVFQVYGMDYKEMGFMAALPLAGGAIGGFLGGFLNDWSIRRFGNRRWARSGVAAIGKGMAGVLLLTSLLFFDQPYVFCSMLFFVKLFGDWSLVTSWGVITDVGGRATATIFTFNNGIAILVGGIAGPLYGALSEGGAREAWMLVFATAAGIYFACAISWLFINCTIPMIKEKPKSA